MESINRRIIAQEFADAINSEYIKQIILFGSVARGDDNPDSDIDILIVSNHKKEIESEVRSIAFDIVLNKQEIISSHIFSEAHLDKIKNFSFMRNVRKEGIILV